MSKTEAIAEQPRIPPALPNAPLLAVRSCSTGFGAFALEDISIGTVILESDGPSVFVLREGEAEKICAWCFEYRANEEWSVIFDDCPGVSFCCEDCRRAWHGKYGKEGLEAYAAVKKFLHARDDDFVAVEDEELTQDLIDETWSEVEEQARYILAYRRGESPPSDILKRTLRMPVVDEENMMFMLDGLLCHATSDWEKVEALQAEGPWRDAHTLACATRAFLHLHCILPFNILEKGHLTRATIERLVASDVANSYGVSQPNIKAERMIARGLWPEVSFFNHSCSPNVSRCRKERHRICKTTRDVHKGEELCITYTRSVNLSKTPVQKRRLRLLSTFGFVCQCVRCKEESGETKKEPEESGQASKEETDY